MHTNTNAYWNHSDHQDKEFTKVLDVETGQPIPMDAIIIGKPVGLLLPDGTKIKTSPVQEWSIYGGTRIVTKHREYWRR